MGICNRCRKSAAQRVSEWVRVLASAFCLRLIIEMDGMKTKTQKKQKFEEGKERKKLVLIGKCKQ